MQQRQHYAVLDGLRGIAAILVLAFHLSEASVTGDASRNLLPHGALAVDFFFCLSGFVIGHAYDRRWASMSLRQFALRRLIRLHPMVIIALIEGLAAFLLRPWRGPHEIVSAGSVALAFIAGLLVLPWRTLPGRGDDTHSLDGPTWTLFQEYIGNIAYALVLRRMPKWVLAVLLVPAAAGLIYGGMFYGTLSKGYGWDGLWMAPVRLAFPFIAGLLLYRVIHHLPARRLGVLPLGLGLAVVFALPVVGGAPRCGGSAGQRRRAGGLQRPVRGAGGDTGVSGADPAGCAFQRWRAREPGVCVGRAAVLSTVHHPLPLRILGLELRVFRPPAIRRA